MKYWLGLFSLCTVQLCAAEHDFAAVIDMRLTHTTALDSYAIAAPTGNAIADRFASDSYVAGGLGKFRFNEGTQVSLAQAGLQYRVDWDNPLSAIVVANSYVDGINNNIGITEAMVKYRGLPSQSGLRWQAKLGLMYPSISLENVATAWTSPYTLSYSTMNSWLGEEFRHLGAEVTLERLGKPNNSKHNFALSGAVLKNNDTAGAMLAWHGWTLSSRQTLLNETLPISNMPSLDGIFKDQARDSDPFKELDNRFGYHIHGQWHYQGHGKLTAGYYDNRADTSIVINGQYTWLTQFSHAGIKWRLPYSIEFISQYMLGSTLMQGPDGGDAVNNDYDSAFVLLSKRWGPQRLSVRGELFSVTDNDAMVDDDNNEDGAAFTLSYQYRLHKNWFIQAEYNYVHSDRPARVEQGLDETQTEQQYQLAVRWFL